MITFLAVCAACLAVQWQHPAGMVTADTLKEIREKQAAHEWARNEYESRKKQLKIWLEPSREELAAVFPSIRANVYHNFSCPDDRSRLTFDPFNARSFRCPACNKEYAPDTDAGIYAKDDIYHGTMYDGWACLFYLTAPSVAVDLAIVGLLENDERSLSRARDILGLFADTIKRLPTVAPGPGDLSRILTYNREGDNKILYELAQAYELLRATLSAEECVHIEKDAIKRILDDVMIQPEYRFDHNNIYQFHRSIVQAAIALERDDWIDWSFGYGAYAPDQAPVHRSLRRIVATHFKPDGAFWELCSGYHLYPLYHFCEWAVLSRNLARMDPERFPPERYDMTHADNEAGKIIKAALEWFVSMAMPDRTMTVVGDSMVPRAGMDTYAATAEVGYRFFDVRAIGDYEGLRTGRRSWFGLLYGAPEIKQAAMPFTSACLSSGWVSLRNEWEGNRVWTGLNALIPGGGHQHADRLSLALFSQGALLALEKATPYNDAETRELGTLTPSHNTVVVDKTSQKQGESLKEGEIPEVAVFAAGPVMQFAELRGDRLYPQAARYRRAVAIVEDVVVDVFRVVGGQTHDWIINHAGPAPVLSIPAEPAEFDPPAWLARGTKTVRKADVGGMWDTRWTVEEVTSRLTFLPSPKTQVFTLETYPVDNAVVTTGHPPCQTLCVRRHDDAPFVAVWDAWRGTPNLQSVTCGESGPGLLLMTRGNSYRIITEPGRAEFAGGIVIESDAVFSVLRNQEAMAFAGGTTLRVRTPKANAAIAISEIGNAWGDWSHGRFDSGMSHRVEYDTRDGVNHPRDASTMRMAVEGSLSDLY